MPATALLDKSDLEGVRALADSFVSKLPKREHWLDYVWGVALNRMDGNNTRLQLLPHYPYLPGIHFKVAVERHHSERAWRGSIHFHVCYRAGECEPRLHGDRLVLPFGVKLLVSCSMYGMVPGPELPGGATGPARMVVLGSVEDRQVKETDSVLLNNIVLRQSYILLHLGIRAVRLDGEPVSLPQRLVTDRTIQTDDPVPGLLPPVQFHTADRYTHPAHRLGQGIRDNVEDADVVFVVGGERIPAHSLVLSAQSEVFRTMLRSGMVEAREKEVKVEDVSSAALQLFLDLLYTGAVEQKALEPHLWTVMMLADKYLVEWVQEVCAAAACGALTSENVLETLEKLQRHRAPQTAIDDVLQYVMQNRMEILPVLDWQQLDPDVATELSRKLAQL